VVEENDFLLPPTAAATPFCHPSLSVLPEKGDIFLGPNLQKRKHRSLEWIASGSLRRQRQACGIESHFYFWNSDEADVERR
jgi:hypothetical protein